MTEAVKNIPTGEIKTLEEAQTVGEELNRLEKVVSQLKENLKGFVEKNGPIQAGNVEWGFSESISWKIKPDKFREVLNGIFLELQVNPWEFVSLQKKALDKLGWNDTQLSKVASKKINKRFTAKKL